MGTGEVLQGLQALVDRERGQVRQTCLRRRSRTPEARPQAVAPRAAVVKLGRGFELIKGCRSMTLHEDGYGLSTRIMSVEVKMMIIPVVQAGGGRRRVPGSRGQHTRNEMHGYVAREMRLALTSATPGVVMRSCEVAVQ